MEIMNIGSKIEEIVREQGLSITDFAKKINCVRKNVYDIFKRNSIDIGLLYRISKVLNHNFFHDLAEEPELAQPIIEDSDEEKRRRDVYQFLDIVPSLVNKMCPDGTIVLPPEKEIYGIKMPDYILGPYMITFTIGETLEERFDGYLSEMLEWKTFTDEHGNSVVLMYSKYDNQQNIDIKIDYKTEEQWKQTLEYAFKIAEEYYNQKTKNEIHKSQMIRLWQI